MHVICHLCAPASMLLTRHPVSVRLLRRVGANVICCGDPVFGCNLHAETLRGGVVPLYAATSFETKNHKGPTSSDWV